MYVYYLEFQTYCCRYLHQFYSYKLSKLLPLYLKRNHDKKYLVAVLIFKNPQGELGFFGGECGHKT